ncbi:MAG: hypothetical protein ACJAU6_002634 [Alphaproteobacteria bacterium]|jgi:hypothetical protein
MSRLIREAVEDVAMGTKLSVVIGWHDGFAIMQKVTITARRQSASSV